ncbi:MAG TPA: cytidine deaminase [Gemmatimonadales bacterium]|nr:cytidine deaminase [Gemmatimonadales bacterium]
MGVSAELVRRAREVMKNAYAPYSKFHVGAAIEADDGTIHVGCNVENASYGLTICAERMAVGAAVAAGKRSLKRVAVATAVEPPATPCGACRQLLAEFGLDLEIIAAGPSSERRWKLRELLPEAFTRDALS